MATIIIITPPPPPPEGTSSYSVEFKGGRPSMWQTFRAVVAVIRARFLS